MPAPVGVIYDANEFVSGRNHINAIEIWSVAKVRLAVRRSLRPECFNLRFQDASSSIT